MKKMTLLYKISYSALFIALGIILSRFVSIPALFGLPFLKISFAPSIVMFSSFYLGPVFGLIVGLLVDILGALMFPTGAFNPLFSIAAGLTGLIPFLAYYVISKIKIETKLPVISIILIIAFNLFIILFMCLNDEIRSESGKKVYTLYPWIKWSVSITGLLLSILYIIGEIILRNKFKEKRFNKFYNIYTITSSVFVTYFIFKIPVGSLVQAFILDWDFLIILTSRMLTGFITSFVHIFIISVALDLSLSFNVKGALISPKILNFSENNDENMEAQISKEKVKQKWWKIIK